MTSSLSDYSSSSLVPAANSLAGLPAAPAAANGATAGAAPDFSNLMGASAGPLAGTAPAPVPELPAGAVAFAALPVRLLVQPVTMVPVAGIAAEPAVIAPEAGITLPAVTVADALAAIVESEPAAPAGPREITRTMIEEAAAFATTLLQTLLPEVQPPSLPEATATVPDGSAAASTPLCLPMVPAAPKPGQAALNADDKPAALAFTIATDGALELKLDLAQFKPVESKLERPGDLTVAVKAGMQREGELAVRMEATTLIPMPTTPGSVVRVAKAIFAGEKPGQKNPLVQPENPGERNFVFTGDKRVNSQSPVAGISVAETETTMPVAPIEEPRATRNPEPNSVLPLRAEFQVGAPPAERITVPAAAPAGQNFAGRAVETVTSLVDTQFTASMQKSGSVQLHLRFGGEDLNVQVQVRDGVVHTDFRTDSPELRSALAREWQAVSAQSPEQMHRFLEPVFSPNAPAPVAASTDTPSSFARHQQQAQQDQQSRSSREAWADSASPFSRRSQLSDSFVPEPVASRAPAFHPTSLRLSALA